MHPHTSLRSLASRGLLAAIVVGAVLAPTVTSGAAIDGHATTAAAAPAATAVTAAGPNCGPTLYKTNGYPWVCTFDEEFNGTALDRQKWTVQTTNQFGFTSGNSCMVDTPWTVSQMNGHLNLTVLQTHKPFTCVSPKGNFSTTYAGASIYTKAFAQRFGRFEVRAKFAQSYGVPGVQGALWLFPNAGSATGTLTGPTEIDIAEAYSKDADNVIPTVHAYTALFNYYKACKVQNWGNAYHTYAVEWSYKLITFYYDNAECFHIATPTSGAVNPFVVALSQAMGVKPNTPTADTPLPAKLQVDYVRVWS